MQTTTRCRLCSEIDSYHRDPAVHNEMEAFFGLPQDERNRAHVVAELFGTRLCFTTVHINFNLDSPRRDRQNVEGRSSDMDEFQDSESDNGDFDTPDFRIFYYLAIAEGKKHAAVWISDAD